MSSCRTHLVGEFNETYGIPGTKFRCHFKESQPGLVVREIAGMSKLIHYFLWPSLGVLIGIGCMIFACKTRPGVNFFTLIGCAHHLEGYVPCCKVSEVPDEEVKKEEEKGKADEAEKMDLGRMEEGERKNETDNKYDTQYGMS